MNRRGFLQASLAALGALVLAPAVELFKRPPLTTLNIGQIESILLETINPILTKQFEQSSTLYTRFKSSGPIHIKGAAFNVPAFMREQK